MSKTIRTDYPFTVCFWVVREKTHTVEVRAWARKNSKGEDVWGWNVYGHVFEDHPMFATPDRLNNMPLHWGATFDEFSTKAPAFGIKNDWQKERKSYTFGSDYMHYQDPEDWQSPLEGIPCQIERDALELAEWLKPEACDLAERLIKEGEK
jgi:hypothetical protein